MNRGTGCRRTDSGRRRGKRRNYYYKCSVLMIHGEKAHSCYFSRDAFSRLQGENKELMIIPDAVHTDLYDRMDVIPFDRILSYTGNACEDGSGKRRI